LKLVFFQTRTNSRALIDDLKSVTEAGFFFEVVPHTRVPC
jgi:hypothetical protein